MLRLRSTPFRSYGSFGSFWDGGCYEHLAPKGAKARRVHPNRRSARMLIGGKAFRNQDSIT